MSTLGKVFAGLVVVLTLVWVILIASVAQLNKNWEAEIDKLEKQVAGMEADLEKTKGEIVQTRDGITQLQVTLGQELSVGRAKRAEAEEIRSAALADLARLKNLQATSEATQKSAEDNRDQRVAEVEAETKELKAKRNEVGELQKTNTAQMKRLADLRDEFLSLQKGNKSKVSQLTQ